MNKIEINLKSIISFLKTASFMETNNTFKAICKAIRYLIDNEVIWKEITNKANINE